MPRAFVTLRESPHYRRDAFSAGLRSNDYVVYHGFPDTEIRATDVLVIWNRYGEWAEWADRFERAGATVLVAENGYFGSKWRGQHWYAISRSQHNGAGTWPKGGPSRWDGWGVELAPMKAGGDYLLLLPQRGIGPPGVAMPKRWEADTVARLGAIPHRVRPHPGQYPAPTRLEDDLSGASAVVTWGSTAALKALLAGVPVHYCLPNWIGAVAGMRFEVPLAAPGIDGRLAMFRRLAWAMWSLPEIETGEAFRTLLCATT